MIKKNILLLILTSGIVSNCFNLGYINGFGPPGEIYSNYKIGLSGSSTVKSGSKIGRACVNRFFVFATLGEASINDAAIDGNIKEIKSVDREVLNILDLYTRSCTVVTGN